MNVNFIFKKFQIRKRTILFYKFCNSSDLFKMDERIIFGFRTNTLED
jgi:hypothetical protein